MHTRHIPATRRERGAALPITLILLVVIMLVAVAAMRSTSFGFIMAANDQLHERAFVASEAGIEQAIATTGFDPNNLAPIALPAGAVGTDAYNAVITTQQNGQPQGAVFGSSWNLFSTYPFQIVSTGTSARSASTVHTQGIAVLAPYNNVVTGPGGL